MATPLCTTRTCCATPWSGCAARELALSVAVREYESRMLVDGFASVGTALRYLTLATARSRALRGTARGFFRTCGAIGSLRRAVFAD
ncbi:hypothetical protein [Streptomyces sp. NPDC047453]|uniref:hypothetical protein n=1 Tax=Streptomyces sp. NPDC047453 TaxID=3154812 RepID=UPI0033FA9A2D